MTRRGCQTRDFFACGACWMIHGFGPILRAPMTCLADEARATAQTVFGCERTPIARGAVL